MTLTCVPPGSSVKVGHVERRLSNGFHLIQRRDKCRVAVPFLIFLHRFWGCLPWRLSLLHVLFIRSFLFLLQANNGKYWVSWCQLGYVVSWRNLRKSANLCKIWIRITNTIFIRNGCCFNKIWETGVGTGLRKSQNRITSDLFRFLGFSLVEFHLKSWNFT